ncbi:geranylgeranyl reductase family protein [Streptomyces sp. CB01881]|uniref:geranylgeranyl reductase family protein n=1 Tax=Streptomyces sp. CB01881 TaxID=2078691 RepID=UPI000CDBE330|nr:geranylgeranyl reductase family protein [Streptomyces sp. CB01881]AUY48083.1 FAD-dependent oxidoreductase [Streptomyces sp. CB01881]TYC76567.1 geranylgeranyl reductase family protein [Streptomyces sp. CB01881]
MPGPEQQLSTDLAPGRGPEHADVIVVGAGPAGSTAAYHLARTGLDVLLLEKSAFPREKVCGDGLTPRAVKQLVDLGIDVSEEAGWLHNRGLRVVAGERRLEFDWPQLSAFPSFGLVRRRADFDELLARRAASAGARLVERANVAGPLVDERTGRITGVTARLGEDRQPVSYHAPLVVAADGNSTRLSLAMQRYRRTDRAMGVAYRTYFTTPRHDDRYLEAWLDLRDPRDPARRLLPGYAWVFGMGDGTANVGLGVLDTAAVAREVDWRDLLRRWCALLPPEYGFTPEGITEPVRGSALPMGLNRQPHYADGLLLIGDAGGTVSPATGEGIAYAMESGRYAAETIVQALARRTDRGRELALRAYPQALRAAYDGYFALGRLVADVLGRPRLLGTAGALGLGHPALLKVAFRLMVNLTEPNSRDALDRLLHVLGKMAPSSRS